MRCVAVDRLAGRGVERMQLHHRLLAPFPAIGHHEAVLIDGADGRKRRARHGGVVGRRCAVEFDGRRLVDEVERQFLVRYAAIALRKDAPKVRERRERFGIAEERLRFLRWIAAVARGAVEVDLDVDAVPLSVPYVSVAVSVRTASSNFRSCASTGFIQSPSSTKKR